jgi:Tol biopolymer transport system component
VRAKNGQLKKSAAPSVNDSKQKTQKKDLNLKFVPFDSATGKLLKVRTFDAKLNSRTNEGPSCFSKDGQTMYLTRNTSKHGKEIANANGEFTVKIYVKQKQGDDWTGETLLPFEDEEYTFCHPTLSADGQRLYFTSNMPGGFGGMDLYMSRRMANGEWSAPSNLGAKVNTVKNELFPFMSEEGTLFFASDGREDAQKLDLYRIDLESKTAKAVSLGAPFNTEADDFGLMLLPNGKKGYFSSNRKGGFGGDDIYEFDIF